METSLHLNERKVKYGVIIYPTVNSRVLVKSTSQFAQQKRASCGKPAVGFWKLSQSCCNLIKATDLMQLEDKLSNGL